MCFLAFASEHAVFRRAIWHGGEQGGNTSARSSSFCFFSFSAICLQVAASEHSPPLAIKSLWQQTCVMKNSLPFLSNAQPATRSTLLQSAQYVSPSILHCRMRVNPKCTAAGVRHSRRSCLQLGFVSPFNFALVEACEVVPAARLCQSQDYT